MTKSGKGRKKGDWVAIAKGRGQRATVIEKGHGVSNIPSVQDTGSAAYRRFAGTKQSKSR